MMEHAEHSPAAIREKAAGAVNCQSVTLPSGFFPDGSRAVFCVFHHACSPSPFAVSG